MNKLMIFFGVVLILVITACASNLTNSQKQTAHTDKEYVCIPCGYGCDTVVYKEPGTCTHCRMTLVERSSISQKQIKPEDLCAYLQKKGNDVVLLDVRMPAEFNGTASEKFGRLRGAINIPIQELEKRLGELEAYKKDKEIIVYCSHSHRSPRASYILTQNGFGRVTNLEGGMSSWQSRTENNACNNNLYISQ